MTMNSVPEPTLDSEAVAMLDGHLAELRNLRTALDAMLSTVGKLLPGHVFHAWETAGLQLDETLVELECEHGACRQAAVVITSLGKFCQDCAGTLERCRGCRLDVPAGELDADGYCQPCTSPDDSVADLRAVRLAVTR